MFKALKNAEQFLIQKFAAYKCSIFKSYHILNAQKCSKVLKSAQSKGAKHFSKKCLVLLKKVPSTFQRTLYTFNVCVKSPGKVLKTFCPKISEKRKKYIQKCFQTRKVSVATTLLSHDQGQTELK